MIELYTASTPNGHKISVLLEELGIDYQIKPVNLLKGEQKTDSFLNLNPNGRIPVIIDKSNNDLVIFESGAIMLYLAEKTGKLISREPVKRQETIQWLMFNVSGIGPMMGQCNVFYRYFPEKIPAAIDRYQHEADRLFSVLDSRLSQVEYLAHDLSIADIANWCWVRTASWSGIDYKKYEHLNRWVNNLYQRPAFKKGIKIPEPVDSDDIAETGKKIITK
ncbi:MAG: glutathione S-transferase N-terminal domain-containing protein [Gammaproteobacteria bacterium]|nr:glutathione S-transferase N-terminal domain-containing protein [Gammaproteobacteria bacterium]MDH5628715.1 glutathione S-transferase N-terminal domain-containing protein [Gammaproteobacteria bacterium]